MAIIRHPLAQMNDAARDIGLTPVYSVPAQAAPSGLIERVTAFSRLAFTAHCNHMIAISRTVCAFAVLLFALTDAPAPGLHREFDDLFALAFAGFAIAALVTSFKSWYLDFTLFRAFIAIDVLAFFILVVSRTAVATGTVAPALCLIAHILFSSVMRWRVRSAFAIAALLNAFWIAEIVLFEMPDGAMAQGEALRWSVFAVIASPIVIWASAQMLTATLPRFAGDAPDPGFPAAASAIDYAMRTAGASGAILCWIDREDMGCYMCGDEALRDELPPTKLGFAAADAFKHLTLMLFDIPRDRAILSANGKLAASVAPDASAVPGHALLAEVGVRAGICIPVDSEEGRSWLILTGVPMLGWGHLHLARAICSEVAQGMSWQIASASALNSALSRLRRTVACDLHDSVAHSLAGARFLLVALRSKVGAASEAAREIDSIKDALDAEHLHVRRLIEQLRQTDSDARARNLIEDIEAVRAALASQWQIEVELIESDFRIRVPVWLSLEIQQAVREAVSNGVRHGKASKVVIRCQRRSGAIEIEVTDNGGGFADPRKPALPRSISDRLGELGGSLRISSNPGSTTLLMSIPSGGTD